VALPAGVFSRLRTRNTDLAGDARRQQPSNTLPQSAPAPSRLHAVSPAVTASSAGGPDFQLLKVSRNPVEPRARGSSRRCRIDSGRRSRSSLVSYPKRYAQDPCIRIPGQVNLKTQLTISTWHARLLKPKRSLHAQDRLRHTRSRSPAPSRELGHVSVSTELPPSISSQSLPCKQPARTLHNLCRRPSAVMFSTAWPSPFRQQSRPSNSSLETVTWTSTLNAPRIPLLTGHSSAAVCLLGRSSWKFSQPQPRKGSPRQKARSQPEPIQAPCSIPTQLTSTTRNR